MRIYLVGKKAIEDDLYMLVDDIDADLTRSLWSLGSEGGYAMGVWPHGSKTHHRRFIHRIILERMIGRRLYSKEFVDHINQNKLDNRRENLRLATHQQNKRNVGKQKHRDGRLPSSQYKGVSLFKRNGRWTASIKYDGRSKRLGYFATEEDAARAYDAAARKHFGEFAYCNFPEQKCPDCAVSPNERHKPGCDIERCSVCNGQWLSCGHANHDPDKSKWTGELPDMRHPFQILNESI